MSRHDDSPFPDDEAVKKITVSKISKPKGAKGNTKVVLNIKTTLGRKNIKTKKKASAPFKRKFKG